MASPSLAPRLFHAYSERLALPGSIRSEEMVLSVAMRELSPRVTQTLAGVSKPSSVQTGQSLRVYTTASMYASMPRRRRWRVFLSFFIGNSQVRCLVSI